MRHQLIPRVIAKLLIPYILLFALYVQLHGDFGPGGGFQAGVIFAAGFILYVLIFGIERAQRVAPPVVVGFFVAAGLTLYAAVGFAGIVLGGNYLDYNTLAHDAVHGQHRGILWIELGVGTTVAAVMVMVFYLFVGRGRR